MSKIENVTFGDVVKGEFERIHPVPGYLGMTRDEQKELRDTILEDYCIKGGYIWSADNAAFSTIPFNYSQKVTFKKGFKFRSDLILKKDLTAYFYWKGVAHPPNRYYSERGDYMMVKIPELTENRCFIVSTDIYSYYDNPIDEIELYKFCDSIKDLWKYMKENFWNMEERRNSDWFYDNEVRGFFKDFFSKKIKERMTIEDSKNFHDAQLTWDLTWKNDITGIPISAKSTFTGNDYVKFRTYCEGDGKDVELTIPIGTVLAHKTTFGEYFNECTKNDNDNSNGKTDEYSWSPMSVFNMIGSTPKIEIAQSEEIEKAEISKITIYFTFHFDNNPDNPEQSNWNGWFDTIDEFIQYLKEYCDKCGCYYSPGKLEIELAGDDLCENYLQWSWRSDRDFGLQFEWDKMSSDLKNWLSKYVKDDNI